MTGLYENLRELTTTVIDGFSDLFSVIGEVLSHVWDTCTWEALFTTLTLGHELAYNAISATYTYAADGSLMNDLRGATGFKTKEQLDAETQEREMRARLEEEQHLS